jgi:hypothetical protein
MADDTSTGMDLNIAPYWDDFDESKRYKRVLAIPSRVAQAREFTQAQTIIQSQITRLGNALWQNGTVLHGCVVTVNDSKTMVQISPGDVYLDGDIVNFSDISYLEIQGVGTEIVGLVRTDRIITEAEDSTLRDPAQNYDNYSQPGAHRLQTTWTWQVVNRNGVPISNIQGGTLDAGTVVSPGLGVITIKEGEQSDVQAQTSDVTKQILDISAQRDFAKSGNYVLQGLRMKVLEHPEYKWDMKRLLVTAGVARIQGYDITLQTNWAGDLPVSRDTDIVLDEPWNYIEYNPLDGTGGEYRLGERPVAAISGVVATVAAVNGEVVGFSSTRPLITRGGTPGGSDELSEGSVVSILGVNSGGEWDPDTETFVGGTNYSPSAYLKDGNNIDWSPSGAEPAPGSSYSVAYTYRKQLVKQIMEMTSVSNELLVHETDDTLSQSYFCEINTYTGATVRIVTATESGDPQPDYVESEYTDGTDFSIQSNGFVDWFTYDVQVLRVLRGAVDGDDDITGLTDGFSFYQVISVASDDGNFNYETLEFEEATYNYEVDTDYNYDAGVPILSWSPTGAGTSEPGSGSYYRVALNCRKYNTSNHPEPGDSYYVSYSYWNIKVPGDYLSRDSFFTTWVEEGDALNISQHYGLDVQDYVNFWKASNHQISHSPGRIDKPYPGTMVEVSYSYYLPKFAVVEYNDIDPVKVHLGTASKNPTEPVFDQQDRNVLLGKVYMPADGLNMVVTEFGVVTLKVVDLHNMRNRITTTEQNLASTMLDMDAKSLPVSNKKGISTSSFQNNDRFDLGWPDVAYSIDPDWQELTFPHEDSLYTVLVDDAQTSGTIYSTVSTLSPSGVTRIEQPYFTGHESIAPYALADQDSFLTSQSLYMTLNPSGDTIIIPRTQYFTDEADADAWSKSDVAKLTDPSVWFAGGWRGGQQDDAGQAGDGGVQAVSSDSQTQQWSSQYIRDIQGVCRQIPVTVTIPGGLPATDELELDFFLYFGGVLVPITLLNGTPSGSVANTFRPRTTDSGADVRFTIPPNVPEGRIEVKVISSPVMINGKSWTTSVTAIFDAAVVEKLTMVFDRCRCNCYACNRCANCWNCRGRCGTGPLAETLEPIGQMRFLRNIELDFYTVNPRYGVYGCIVNTENGNPTSNTVANGMIARKFLSATQLVGAGMKTFTFDDPIFFKDEAYAIVVTGEDGFNINSTNEIAAGRDIRCKIAKLGAQDEITGVTVGTNPFKNGIFWRSLTGVTWEQDQTSDIKFRASFNLYPTGVEQIVQMQPVELTGTTAFIATWNSQVVDGTKVIFEYRTREGSWTEFSPYMLIKTTEVADQLTFRARLSSTVPNLTPFVENSFGLYVQSTQPTLKVVTRAIDLIEASNILDIWLQAHLPSACSQSLRVTFDNGTTWVDLAQPVDGLPDGNLIDMAPVDLNADNVKYNYHWQVTLDPGQVFSSYRVEIGCTATGSTAKLKNPRFSNFISIASNS